MADEPADVAEGQAAAWVAGGRDAIVARLVDEMPDLPDRVLYPLRFALASTTDGSVDARWAFGYAAGLAAQASLTWTAAVLQRLARCEGWVRAGPPWSPLDVNAAGHVTDAVDRAVDELARVCAGPALDAAEVWVAGGSDELTLRLARAVPDDDGPLGSMRAHLKVAGGSLENLVGDRPSHVDRPWALGVANGIAKALGLGRVLTATVVLATAYSHGTPEPDTSTVGAVDAAVEELDERFGAGSG